MSGAEHRPYQRNNHGMSGFRHPEQRRKTMKMTYLGVVLAGSAAIASMAQAEDTLTAVHAFPETLIYTQSFLSFVD